MKQTIPGSPMSPETEKAHSRGSPKFLSRSRSDLSRVGDHDDENDSAQWLSVSLKAVVLLVVVIGAPCVCRNYGLSSPSRCIVLIVSVLFLNLAEVMPLYCTALFIPVLGTLCEVLGDSRSLVDTSTLLVANIFNNISFLVLGALVINGIFVKCKLERRLVTYLTSRFEPDSPYFLLAFMLGGMAMCSVLYSGSLVLLSALRPLILPTGAKDPLTPPVAKRLLLAVAFCSNAGSVWLPISSPVNLITVSLLREFEYEVHLTHWVMVAIPVSTIAMIALWPIMLYLFPQFSSSSSPQSPRNSLMEEAMKERSEFSEDQLEMMKSIADQEIMEQAEVEQKLTGSHYFFLLASVVALLSITVFMPYLEPIVGHAACISLSVVVLAFGSGFMSREEFLQLDWDLLMLVGGTNVMAFLVRETGLGAELSSKLIGSEFFTMLPYWGMLAVLLVGTVTISTTVGHTLTGVLLLPLVVALGVKLQAAETTALLCAIAVPFGMGLPQSSFDNSAAYTTSRCLGRQRIILTQRDFRIPGVAVTIIAVILLLFLGFGTCVFNYGMPPPVIVSEVSKTPEKLQPKIVIENRPKEAEEVSYNGMMDDWKTFLEKPDEKAFAVGKLKEGLKTRPWAASWNHATQEEANKAALAECEKLSEECRIIYPTKIAEVKHSAEDIREAGDNGTDVKGSERTSFLHIDRHGALQVQSDWPILHQHAEGSAPVMHARSKFR
mmetsp:Transcript_24101/g.38288  ORF Transcript_24101/g.38288 Transcript_24101/m.38288 type:complete len:720 (+) Transcript_24101:110-2269(+)